MVGSYLLPKLVKDGHDIYAVTRAASKIDKINDIGARGIQGDILEPQEILKELPEKPEFIILLAMPGITPGKRINKKRKAVLRAETVGFFRNSMDLAIYFNAPIILPSGTSYQTGLSEIADETWPIRRVGLTEVGRDTDEMINQALRIGRPEFIQLIYGRIYGNGGLFRFQYDMLKKNRYKIIGKGENYIPVIHANDAASANSDTDSDGLINLDEHANGTNPRNPDTDGDGMPDGWEVINGLAPKDASDAAANPDADPYTNLQEYTNGTDPFAADP